MIWGPKDPWRPASSSVTPATPPRPEGHGWSLVRPRGLMRKECERPLVADVSVFREAGAWEPSDVTVEAPAPLLVLRPGPASRATGWAMVVFALLFGFAGIVQDGSGSYDWGAGVLMELFSVLTLALGISLSTAKATVTSSQIRYRYGIVRRAIPSGEVESVVVGPGSGAYYRRICLHIRQRGRTRPLRLIALQRPETAKGQAELEQTAARVRATIGI